MRLAASAAVGEALANLTPRTADRGAQAALAWPAACGDPLARFTRPLGYEEGLLVVGVAGRIWRDVLYQERKLVIARLRQRVPGLRGFRLVNLPEVAPEPPPPAPAPTPTRLETADIADAELRAALDRLLAARDARR